MQSELFQEDLFPDTPGKIPALTAEEWAGGKSCEPILMEMIEGFKQKDKPKIKGLGAKAGGLKGFASKPKSASPVEQKPAPVEKEQEKPQVVEHKEKPVSTK